MEHPDVLSAVAKIVEVTGIVTDNHWKKLHHSTPHHTTPHHSCF